jgi:hypothetical protein
LLSGYPDLVQWLDKQNTQSPIPLSTGYYKAALPAYIDIFTKYYALIISKEFLHIYNAFLIKSWKWTNKVDIIYNTTILLKSLKALTQQVFKINERGWMAKRRIRLSALMKILTRSFR